MSKADWGFLEHLLEEGQEHSTGAGRVWLTVLFLFRILVLGTAAESAWNDEQSDFICNTLQPGCELVCYDKAFPISHFRFFVLQVIFVSTPTAFYFAYVVFRHKRREKELEEAKAQGLVAGKDGGRNQPIADAEKVAPEKPKLRGKLLCAYTFSICIKMVLEVVFMLGMYLLYGFFIHPKYECERAPCPHKVDCFVSRPTEKTIFTIYMMAVSAISVLLNAVELLCILQWVLSHKLEKRFIGKHQDSAPPRLDSVAVSQSPLSDQEGYLQAIPVGDISYPQPYRNYIGMENKITQDQDMDQRSTACSLPTYLNGDPSILTSMSKPESKRSSHKIDRRGRTKSISQQKHYV